MEVRRCMRCMHELAAEQKFCPECGRPCGSVNTESFALKPGTILDGKYLVGEMLGQGGFGITYIGFDLLLEQKVAIKEYFPMSTGMVSRENRSMVVWSNAMMGKTGTQKGFDSFLKEARKMAKLGGIPGVVGVKSVFIQNETAYIVMDFIEGETLLKKLQREGPMPFDTCLSLLMPIIQALAEVHEHGIIHRDISPDNIMVRPDGRLILLDLGAAKDLDIQGRDGNVQSSQMVAKQGFSPIEQYQRNASIGPWTDVYAMAATIYYCCTGILPPTAVDRIVDDTLTCQPLLTQAQFDVLAYCMSIRAENRPKNMTALLQMTTLSSEKKNEPLKEFSMAESPRLKEIKVPERATITMTAPSANLVHRKSRVMVKASCSSFGVYFWGQNQHKCTDVKRLTFQSTLKNAPSYAWDVSNTKDRSVLAWMINGHLYVAANGTIAANSDSSCMFANFSNMKKIDFGSCLDTTKVTDMSNMFLGCNSLASLNLTSFDTSNVMDMSGMFEGCPSLTKLDLSSFNTFNVKSMYHMFSGCSNLVSLNLSHFGSPYAADTTGMFNHCYKLKNINCFSSKILESYHSR